MGWPWVFSLGDRGLAMVSKLRFTPPPFLFYVVQVKLGKEKVERDR